MASNEVEELKEMIGRVEDKVDIIGRSLRNCQSHCYVDNPPGRWRNLFRAFRTFFSRVE
jgi:hypothetical protein